MFGAVAMGGDLYFASHVPASTEVLKVNSGPAEFLGAPCHSGGLELLPAPSFHVDLQHDSGAASGAT